MAIRTTQFFALAPEMASPEVSSELSDAYFRAQMETPGLTMEAFLRQRAERGGTEMRPVGPNYASAPSAAPSPARYQASLVQDYGKIKEAISQGKIRELAPRVVEGFFENVASLIEKHIGHLLPADKRHITAESAVKFLENGSLPQSTVVLDGMADRIRLELLNIVEPEALNFEGGLKVARPVFQEAASRYQEIRAARLAAIEERGYVAPVPRRFPSGPQRQVKPSFWGKAAEFLKRFRPGRH